MVKLDETRNKIVHWTGVVELSTPATENTKTLRPAKDLYSNTELSNRSLTIDEINSFEQECQKISFHILLFMQFLKTLESASAELDQKFCQEIYEGSLNEIIQLTYNTGTKEEK